MASPGSRVLNFAWKVPGTPTMPSGCGFSWCFVLPSSATDLPSIPAGAREKPVVLPSKFPRYSFRCCIVHHGVGRASLRAQGEHRVNYKTRSPNKSYNLRQMRPLGSMSSIRKVWMNAFDVPPISL